MSAKEMSRKEIIRALRRLWRGERKSVEQRVAVLEEILGLVEVLREERDLCVALVASMGRFDEMAAEELGKEKSGAAFKRQCEVVTGDWERFVEYHDYWGKVAKD